MIDIRDEKVLWLHDGEKMQIEPWGENSFRVRVTNLLDFTGEDWALLKQPGIQSLDQQIIISADSAVYCVIF